MGDNGQSDWPRAECTMAALIRQHDWAKAGLGRIGTWSEAMRAAVDILLELPVPAVLLCGRDLVQIYNDPYRRVLGNRHPAALGQPTRKCWPEVWDFNRPLYEAVLEEGKSFSFSDKALTLERDGASEEAFFTLTYSAVPNLECNAILVTAEETTERVRTRELQKERDGLISQLSQHRLGLLEEVFELAPSFLHILQGNNFTIEFANEAFRRLAGCDDLQGMPVLDVLPGMAASGLEEILRAVLDSGEPYVGGEFPITVRTSAGETQHLYIDICYHPLFERDGSCARILGHGFDVTEQVQKRQASQTMQSTSSHRFRLLAQALARITAASHQSEIMEVVRSSARELTGADGISLVLKDGDQCHYVSEDSPLGPLWQGRRFPSISCISGWSISRRETAIVESVFDDPRVPLELYKPTFVRSIVMVPLDTHEPTGAIGAYWSEPRCPEPEQVALLEALAQAAGNALDQRATEQRLRQSEARMDALFARAPVGLSEISLAGEVLRVNDELCRIVGRSPEVMRTVGIPDVTHPDDVAHSLQTFGNVLASGHAASIDKRYVRPNGEVIWSRSSLTRLEDAGGEAYGVLAVTVDLSERVAAEEALRASEGRYRALADLSPDGILVQADDAIQYANAAAARIMGARSAEDLVGVAALQFVDERYRELVQLRIGRLLESDKPAPLLEERWRRVDGKPVDLEVSAAPVVLEGKKAVQILIRDITERKQAEKRVWEHANFCPLTRLPNRRLFRDRLGQEVKKAYRGRYQLGLLFIDLDGFKQVNDRLGHDVGDQLLQEAARRLEQCVRHSDTVARLGGDEFTVILGELEDASVAEKVAQKIVTALSQTFYLGKEAAHVTGSVGITVFPDDASTSQELIRKADQAMYAAKQAGKNQFSYFTHEMDEKAHLRLRLAAELRDALQENQLEVYYQPIVCLRDSGIRKAEALLRWNHPIFGLVEPSQFIPLAEESGLISEIGDWVFTEAATCAKRWEGLLASGFQISVNKSPLQFRPRTSQQEWPGFLKDLDVPGHCISVEITEGVLLHASHSVADRLLEYRDAGIQVAIDDFGTGYSSMAYLKKFHIDYLKIDRSFVSDITDASARTIAETIIIMAHKLGLKVIAEGIETREQMDILASAGCDYGQGYLFSPAVPEHEFEQLLAYPRLPRTSN